MLCIYHSADHDGKGSAAIIKRAYPNIECMGHDWGRPIQREEILKHDKIIICDIGFSMDFMNELNETKDLTWIDHHGAAIKNYEKALKEGKCKEIKGLRKEGTAAIELTWQYFRAEQELPLSIKLLAINDVCRISDIRSYQFDCALQAKGNNLPEDPIWDKLFNNEIDVEKYLEEGKGIITWFAARNARLAEELVFISEYKGHSCICANVCQGFEEFFESIPNYLTEYDFMTTYHLNNHGKWILRFYSEKEGINASDIATEFGGYGHPHAAGATVDELPEFYLNGKPFTR